MPHLYLIFLRGNFKIKHEEKSMREEGYEYTIIDDNNPIINPGATEIRRSGYVNEQQRAIWETTFTYQNQEVKAQEPDSKGSSV